MEKTVFALPVSLEQIAALIKRMTPQERRELIELVPELRQESMHGQRTLDEARESVEQLRVKVMDALGGKPLSPNTPFLDGLTLGEYQKLPNAEKARLWDKWEEIDLEELEVPPDAVPAR